MADAGVRLLLDQNVPRDIAAWLRARRPAWIVSHVRDVRLAGKPDREVFAWAQRQKAIIITFDEDFADVRMFPLGKHCGVVRLRKKLNLHWTGYWKPSRRKTGSAV